MSSGRATLLIFDSGRELGSRRLAYIAGQSTTLAESRRSNA